MKAISQEKQASVIRMLDAGISAKKIAAQLKISSRTVRRIRDEARPGIQKARGGRPAKLSCATKHRIKRMITTGEVDTATQAAKQLRNEGIADVNPETVRNVLKEIGFKAVTKKKKRRLLARHKKQRMEFATKYKDWTVDDWKRMIWSDETKINRLGSDGRQWVWKQPGSAITDQHVKGTVKHGGGNLKMWGCMTAEGVGYACRIDSTLDAELYTRILDDEFLQTLEYYGMERDDILFQQDNDPKHSSRLARQWFDDHGIEVLPWPAQSPDLNPMEHLWQHLKRQLAAYESDPKSMHELWERVEAEWNKIPAQVCINLIDSMPRRVAAVYKAKGGHTKY